MSGIRYVEFPKEFDDIYIDPQCEKGKNWQGSNISDYYRTEHWWRVKHYLRGKYPKCQVKSFACIGEIYTGHHVHYKSLGREKWEDVTAVCQACHGVIHADKNSRKQLSTMLSLLGLEFCDDNGG